MLVLSVRQGAMITIGSTKILLVTKLHPPNAWLELRTAGKDPLKLPPVHKWSRLNLGSDTILTVLKVRPSLLRLGFDAPPETSIVLVDPGT